MPHIIHTLEDALALLAKGEEMVAIQNAPGSIFYSGVGYFKALCDEAVNRFPAATLAFTLDCGDNPALVQQAIRLGFKNIIFTGSGEVLEKLQQIGQKAGVTVQKL